MTDRRTAHVSAVMLLMTAAFMLARTGRDAWYFQQGGIQSLPFAYLGMALLALPMAALLLSMVRVMGIRRTRVVAVAAMTAVLAAAGLAGRPGGGPAMTLFFVLVPVVFGGLFSLSWLLAGEIIGRDSPDLVRAFSRTAAASILGGLFGAGLARGLAPWLAPRGLLLISAATLAAALLAIALTHRRFPPIEVAAPTGPIVARPAFATALAEPYVRLLLSIAALAAFSGVLIEFLFYQAASSCPGGPAERIALFANFYIGLGVAGLAIQWFVAARLQAAIGLAGSLLILPGAIVGLMPAVIGFASGIMPAVLRLTEGGLKASLHRSSWEQTYLAIGPGCRTEAKLLVDGVGTRLAEGLGAALLFVGPAAVRDGSGSSAFIPALVVAGVAWLVLTLRARRYLGSGEGMVTDPAECYARMPDS